MCCKLCGNTEGGTASHTAKASGERGHKMTTPNKSALGDMFKGIINEQVKAHGVAAPFPEDPVVAQRAKSALEHAQARIQEDPVLRETTR